MITTKDKKIPKKIPRRDIINGCNLVYKLVVNDALLSK